MKYFSLFSGIGGFELGIKRAIEEENKLVEGTADKESQSSEQKLESRRRFWEYASCVGYSEIDKYAIQTYRCQFPEHKNWGDATKINTDELPDFDVLVGGFPCQAFSVAGKRAGFDDTRGTLFFEIARIAKAKKPKIILLENVKGLLNHNKGETFRVIIQTLWELGYTDLQWYVFNSKYFRVPQNRERVFIIGHLTGQCGQPLLPIREDAGEIQRVSGEEKVYDIYNKQFRKDGIAGTLKGEGISETSLGTAVPEKKEEAIISPCITTENAHIYGDNVTVRQTEAIQKANEVKRLGGIFDKEQTHQAGSVYDTKGIAPILDTCQGGHRQPIICEDKSKETVIAMNLQTRSPDRPSMTRKCDCGSGKLYCECCGQKGGSGTLGKVDEGFCLDTGCNQGVARCLDANMHKGVTPESFYDKKERNIVAMRAYPRTGTKDKDGDRVQNIEEQKEDTSNTLTNVQKDNLVVETSPTLYGFEHGTHQQFNEILPNTYGMLRRLTPVECERLQGFPDDWTKYGVDDKGNLVKISDTQRYKQLGNAVTVNVIEAIIDRLIRNGE